MPKVSIIIPIYNAEEFLKRCLDSILDQTLKDIEVICVNDGSKDNSLQILKEYQKNDDRIIIIDKKNEGVSAARNDGINKSSGEYIAFADADDWLEKNALEEMYNACINQNVDVVRSNYFENESENTVIKLGSLVGLENQIISSKTENFVDIIHNKMYNGELLCYVWVLLIKKEILMKTNLFEKGIPYCEDLIFYSELISVIDNIYFLDKPTYHYYSNPVSCSKSKEFYIRNMHSLARAYEKISDLVDKDKFDVSKRKEVFIDFNAKKIMWMLFSVYLSEDRTQSEWVRLIEEVMQDKTIVFMIKNANISKMPQHLAIPFRLIAKEKYNALVKFYKIRKIIRNIKLQLKKR